jgi:hypothetical protein
MNNFLPMAVIEHRKLLCQACSCKVEFESPCASCPNGKWKEQFCISPPSLKKQISSLAKSSQRWIRSGLRLSDQKTIQQRVDICSKCEFWEQNALIQTGRCMKCGCSTWAKIRVATEKCPVGKWLPLAEQS